MELKLCSSGEGIYHIKETGTHESMLSRYGVISYEDAPQEGSDAIRTVENGAVFMAKRRVQIKVQACDIGYELRIPLSEDERIFGLGDSNRESIMIRGMHITLWKENVKCYGPMPILLSSSGYSIFLNTTYKTEFDIGKSKSDELYVRVCGGEADMFIFVADRLLSLIQKITEICGKPMLLPKFAYGLTVVNNEGINDVELLEYTRLFRQYDIPCDCMGLEPYWMQCYYDFSTNKEWNKEKFRIPYWKPKNTSDKGTFFHPLRRMGMQLSLWLCEDYDLLYHEEKRLRAEQSTELGEDAEERDYHLTGAIFQDKVTKSGERWFKHLEPFVDNGAAAFKLDASNQVLEHPDRLWGGRFFDDEVHNVYPVLLAKDMANGYRDYVDRRLMINTSCAYVGTQKYAATWAGDTGGGPRTLVSVMNYAMCGHSNTSCDFDASTIAGMHYGFLMPWTQQNNWCYWNYPWYLGDTVCEEYRAYARLRSSLFPYLYYAAYQASRDGIPMMRPLPLVDEEDRRFDNVQNAYMLGDSLYVGVFDMHLALPKGEWVDYFTGKVYEGGGEIDYVCPEHLGGALLVKNGAVVVTMTPQKYLLEREHDYIIHLYPAACASHTVIYEDDGFTYDYETGGYACTDITSSGIQNGKLTLTVGQREGTFSGRPDNGHSIADNSIPHIPSPSQVRDMTVVIHGITPHSVALDGMTVDMETVDGGVRFTVPSKLHAQRPLPYLLEF